MTKMNQTGRNNLHIDLETYSEVDLKQCGMYRYVDDPSFEILLLAYAYGDDPIRVIDLAQGEQIPLEIIKDITQPKINKIAHNAAFERLGLTKHIYKSLNTPINPKSWICSSVRAASLGLPHSLGEVAIALELDNQKKLEGRTLIRIFCKPTHKGTRTYPEDRPEDWDLFKEYCAQDVEVEREIYRTLSVKPATLELEQELYIVDQKMNDKGVLINQEMVRNTIDYNVLNQDALIEEAREMGIDNPKSVQQSRKWLKDKGIETDSLNKAAVKEILKIPGLNPIVKRFLKIKQELGKTSIAKYDAMDRSVCSDGRVHGMLQFYGAERTGRWAGRIVQLQNLPRNTMKDLDLARNTVIDNDFELMEMLYASPTNVCSQLIRTTFIPETGKVFVIADYSAIEARVLAWLANEGWREAIFESHGKIYEASASAMFNVPIEDITKDSPLRAKGKVAELALGYQGSVGALKAMGAEDMGLSEEEMLDIVIKWRNASPNIVNYWNSVDEAAKEAIYNPGLEIYIGQGVRRVSFKMIEDTLFIKLPSGRQIAYFKAQVRFNIKRGAAEIVYFGRETGKNTYQITNTYGGKLVENITQATARDCLAWAMVTLSKNGYLPSFHVHDEVVIEVLKENVDTDIEKIKSIMSLKSIEWTAGLKLTADAFMADYYRKD